MTTRDYSRRNRTNGARFLLLGLAMYGACGLPLPVAAQEGTTAPVDTPKYGWTHGLVAGLNLTQASFSNWVQGGENALAFSGTIEGKSNNAQEATLWENQYRFAYGQSRVGSKGFRKTDDIIDISTILSLAWSGKISPYASATAKTQFSTGYTYDANDVRTNVSAFLDPGYFTQAVGMRYQPITEVTTRLGVAMREVVTTDYPVYADDPATVEIEKTLAEGGIESVTDVDWKIEETILFKAKLAIFAPFERMDETIVGTTLTLTGKISSNFSAILGYDMIYDRRVSPTAQQKQNMALGLSYALL